MPSYIVLTISILGISIVPTSTSGTSARGSAGGLSGFGSVAGTVVAGVVDVVVEVVDVVTEIDVVGGVVVEVVAAVVATEDAVAASALGPSSPQAERTSNAAHVTAIDCRRMTQSAIENQRCNAVATAC